MHHKMTLTVGKASGRPYHVECSCGSAGDFPKETKARAWVNSHFARLGKVETSELSVPGAVQPKPLTHPAPPKPPPAPAGGGKK